MTVFTISMIKYNRHLILSPSDKSIMIETVNELLKTVKAERADNVPEPAEPAEPAHI